MPAQLLNTWIEGRVAAKHGIDRHGAGQQPHGKVALRFEQPVEGDRCRNLSAVEKGETFLGPRHHRSDPGFVGCVFARDRAVSGEHAAFSQKNQRHMGERCEIAGCADRALTRNRRQHVGVQQCGEGVKRFDSDAGVTT